MKKVNAGEVVDAKKDRFDENAAWELLKNASSITIAKGKKVQIFKPGEDDRAEILKNAMGPSGNLRAPTYRAEDQFVIGFNADLYEEWVK